MCKLRRALERPFLACLRFDGHPKTLLGSCACDGPQPSWGATANAGGETPIRSVTRKALVILSALAVAISLAAGSAAADPTIGQKRAQAEDVLNQIHAIDSQLERSIEAFNAANVRLGRIDVERKSNARHLVLASSSLANAQVNLEQRLVALYTDGQQSSVLEVLLGAKSLDDLLSRLDNVEQVSNQDARVLREVTAFRAEVRNRKARLERARREQARHVAERAAQKQSVESQLAKRQVMLASVKDEIAQLEAAEQLRQRSLVAQAKARLAAQSSQPASQSSPTTLSFGGSIASPDDGSTPPPARYGGAIGIAMQYLGTPYVWGGAAPGGFDCSGFIMYVYAQLGVSLPHNAAMQYGYGSPVAKSDLESGDLVFFDGLGHNGMYIGGGQFIHSPHTGDVVKISSLSDFWYSRTWVGARRL